MEFLPRASAILSYLTGNPAGGACIVLRARRHTGRPDDHRVHYNPYLHTAKAYQPLVEALTVSPVDIPLLKIPVGELTESPKICSRVTMNQKVSND